jgi:hypothetical protein
LAINEGTSTAGTYYLSTASDAGAYEYGGIYHRPGAFTTDATSTLKFEAEAANTLNGVDVLNNNVISSCDTNDYIKFTGVDLGKGYAQITASVATTVAGGQVEVRIGSTTGTLLGTLTLSNTGGLTTFTNQIATLSTLYTGINDIYIVFKNGTAIGNFDWFQFDSTSSAGLNYATRIIPATSYSSMNGISNSGTNIGSTDNNDWVCYNNIDFNNSYTVFSVNIATPTGYQGKNLEVRLDSTTGTLLGTLTTQATGSDFTTYKEQSIPITSATGVHNLYVVFKGGYGVGNITQFKFDYPSGYVNQSQIATKQIIQAEDFNASSGITTGSSIGSCDNGDYVKFSNINFGTDTALFNYFSAKLGTPNTVPTKYIKLKLDSATGTVIGTLSPTNTGGYSIFAEQNASLNSTTGIHDLYICFEGGWGVCNLDWFSLYHN